MTTFLRRTIRIITVALMLHLTSTATIAGTVDFEPVVGTITGTDSTVFPFEVTGPGPARFSAILTDLESPAPFQLLGLGLFFEDVPGTPFALINEPGSIDGRIDPGRYLALVGGIADADTNIGTFGLEISAIPIPAAGWLFVSAIIGLGFLGRRCSGMHSGATTLGRSLAQA